MKGMLVASVLAAWALVLSPAWASSDVPEGSVVILHGDDLTGAAERLREAIPRLKAIVRERTGFSLDSPFTIEIIRDRDDFVRLSGGSMYAALAIPAENRIILDLSQMRVHPVSLELMALHEMCHLVLHQNIEEGLLPKWLDEGVSQWVSGGVGEILIPQGSDALETATLRGKLLRFYEIAAGFPSEQSLMTLAYSESRSMVEHLEAEFGEDAVRGVLSRLSRGVPLREALSAETGEDFADIERKWRMAMKRKYGWIAYLSDNISWILFIIGAALLVFAFARLRRRIRNYPEEDDLPPQDD